MAESTGLPGGSWTDVQYAADSGPPLDDDPNSPLTLTVLTGFLGSGKTTILRALLQNPPFHRAAVVIGEFGEIAIDHHLIRPLGHGVTTLMDGCPCCTLQDDLVTTLRLLWRQRRVERVLDFDRIILETSGLAEAAPILNAVQGDAVLRGRVKPALVLCTADVMHLEASLALRSECARQLAVADRLIVTKADLATEERIATMKRLLTELAPGASVHIARNGRIEDGASLLAAPGGAVPSAPNPNLEARSSNAHGTRHHGVATFAMVANEPLSWSEVIGRLSPFLAAERHGILRMKGILNILGRERPTVVHAIQGALYPPILLPEWPDRDRRSRLVFITTGLDSEEMKRLCPLGPHWVLGGA